MRYARLPGTGMFTENEDGFELEFDDSDLDAALARSLAEGIIALMKLSGRVLR